MRQLVYRQSIWTRVTHWTWVLCLIFLLMSGLQIFNARPDLYIGQQSGFGFDNSVLRMSAVETPTGPEGQTELFGHQFDTTGVFGVSGPKSDRQFQGFPSALTVPSYRDLATGRVIHFFFAWLLVGTLLLWLVAGLFNGHIRRDLLPKGRDLRALPNDVLSHLRFRFSHGQRYNPLQKLSYFTVIFALLPLMVLTGLTMSPGMDAAWPWLLEIFGGRQTARSLHFAVACLLVLFFLVHIAMVVAAGPINELRSMITGWFRPAADVEVFSEEEK
ncbi:cytochrome b/b6 domain-containing protein [Ferirhizobium litorale]|uniref:Cytochrome b/b6 domain-containing protein n=1 Tax=Ferirhizobium litorale TaxID=2927786 RepID=A0AAE3U0K8_9HYPH|nr:cytochrome b/b6 domain-containing protein [Fererhizobium litorale]MDI7922164.1 cytochrome b/b6 domain-containing protein [Fererhizobium litorale]